MNALTTPDYIPSVLSRFGQLFFTGLSYEDVTEFKVNGEPADVRDYVMLTENETEEDEAAEEYESLDDSYDESFDEEELLIANRKIDPEA